MKAARHPPGGKGRIRTDFLRVCFPVCFLKHLFPVLPPQQAAIIVIAYGFGTISRAMPSGPVVIPSVKYVIALIRQISRL